MLDYADVQARNRELAKQLNAEARANPGSPYAGKFVGIANGRVVIVAEDLDEVAERLRQAEPTAPRTLIFEAGFDYSRVVELWRLSEEQLRYSDHDVRYSRAAGMAGNSW